MLSGCWARAVDRTVLPTNRTDPGHGARPFDEVPAREHDVRGDVCTKSVGRSAVRENMTSETQFKPNHTLLERLASRFLAQVCQTAVCW